MDELEYQKPILWILTHVNSFSSSCEKINTRELILIDTLGNVLFFTIPQILKIFWTV